MSFLFYYYCNEVDILGHCTEVRFSSLLSGGFTTMAVINPTEKKLENLTSVQCVLFTLFDLCTVWQLRNSYIFFCNIVTPAIDSEVSYKKMHQYLLEFSYILPNSIPNPPSDKRTWKSVNETHWYKRLHIISMFGFI